ncbi:MAG: MFS transporter, partial [Bacteroidota bacterium]
MEPWRKNLYILWSTQFVSMLGISFISPFLPFFIRDLGVTDEHELARWTGLTFAAPFFVSFFMVPIWGWLGDRYGRKLMIVRATYGLAVAQVLVGLSQSVEQLFIFRMLQGSVSGFIPAALALTSASTPKERSGYAIGVLQTAISAGTVVGPLVGGALADAFGFRPIFFIVAGMFMINGIFVIKGVKEIRTDEDQPRRYRFIDNYTYALTGPNIRLALILIVASQIAIGMVHP